MTNKELIDKYTYVFGHLDFKSGEILSVEDMVSSCEFSEEESKRIINLLLDDSESNNLL